MEEKLRILMQNEKLTATRFAELLEIQPAAVSHLLKGRNKPSYDLICKIARKFPRVNLRWLLGDEEQIYTSEATPESSQPATIGGLFDELPTMVTPQVAAPSNVVNELVKSSSSMSEIEHIIFVYRDKSFEVLSPKG